MKESSTKKCSFVVVVVVAISNHEPLELGSLNFIVFFRFSSFVQALGRFWCLCDCLRTVFAWLQFWD
ncbi:hypothetical protein P8452_17246 [Trifolium repens]|nr:hypothetical protein P8452_17246 [Trifolium repens]